MNAHKSIDWLIDAYHDHRSSTASPIDCSGLIEKLKDPAHVQALIEEAAIAFHDPLIPKQFGDFDILGTVGAGGMGEVFRVRHRKLNRIQALKLLPPHRLENQQANRRFEREMQAIGQLKHPNIVTVYDAGVVDETPFMSMELIDGQSLAQLVRDHKKNGTTISIEQAVEIIVQAAKGVEHAHQNNIFHRDIKPANLMLDKNGTVKLLDLGLAKLNKTGAQNDSSGIPSLESRQLTADQQILGTPDFMAPEQISGTVDERTDIYALGATFYYLLTGQVLFPEVGSSLIHRALAVTGQQAPLANMLRVDIPDSLNQIIAKSLSKNPANRQQSASQFIAEIQAAAKTLNQTHTETTAEKAAKTVAEPQGEHDHQNTGRRSESPQSEVAASQPRKHPTAKTSRGWPPIGWLKVGLAGLVPLGLILLSIFLFKGPDGSTLEVVCDDPNVVVEAEWVGEENGKPAEATVELGEQTKRGKSTKLKLGPWKLSIKGDNATKYSLSKDQVKLKRGEETIVNVTLVDKIAKQNDSGVRAEPTAKKAGNAAKRNKFPTDAEILARLDNVDWSKPGTYSNAIPGMVATPSAIEGLPPLWQVLPKTMLHAEICSISPTGKYVVYSRQHSPYLYVAQHDTGRVVASLRVSGYHGNGAIAWNPDETEFLLSAENIPQGAAFYSVDGTFKRFWKSELAPDCKIYWSPDGQRIIAANQKVIEMRTPEGDKVSEFEAPNHGHNPYNVDRIAWSPDSKMFACATAQKVYIYERNGGKPIVEKNVHEAWELVWHPSGQHLWWTTAARKNYLCDLNGKIRNFPEVSAYPYVRFSPDGRYLLDSAGSIFSIGGEKINELPKPFWNRSGREPFRWYEPGKITLYSDRERGCSLELSPNGKALKKIERPFTLPFFVGHWSNESDEMTSVFAQHYGYAIRRNWMFQWKKDGNGESKELPAPQSHGFPSVGWNRAKDFFTTNGYAYDHSKTSGRHHQAKTFSRAGEIVAENRPSYLSAWSQDGTQRAACYAYSDRLTIYRKGKTEFSFDLPFKNIANIHWSPDGKRIAIGFSRVQHRCLVSLEDKSIVEIDSTCMPEFCPSGKHCAIWQGAKIILLDEAGKEQKTIEIGSDGKSSDGHVGFGPRIAWHSEGTRFMTSSGHIYDLQTEQKTKLTDWNPCSDCKWVGDRLISVWQNSLKIWESAESAPKQVQLPFCYSSTVAGRNARENSVSGAVVQSQDKRYLSVTLHSLVHHEYFGGNLCVVDLQTGNVNWTCIGYSDGARAVVSSNGQVHEVPKGRFDDYLLYTVGYINSSNRFLKVVALSQLQFASRIGLSSEQKFLQEILDLGGKLIVENGQSISASDVPDARYLPAIDTVTGLDLSNNHYLSPGFLSKLEFLPSIKTLNLRGSNTADWKWDTMRELKTLESLDLSSTSINYKLAHGLPKNISELNLSNTIVTDFFLYDLLEFKSLKSLNLTGTKATKTGIKQLKHALPKCKVDFESKPIHK